MKRMLSFENISKSYGEKDLFHHINGNIASRDRIGLIGVNGTGKSTFLQVIAGGEPADSGEIQHAIALRIEYLPKNPHCYRRLLGSNRQIVEKASTQKRIVLNIYNKILSLGKR